MSTSTIVWIIVAVIVVVALAAVIAAVARRKKLESNRSAAQSLRHQTATEKAADIERSRVEAQEAEARAARARLEAERAQRQAADAQQGVHVEEAAYEDRLREADRLDPDVDHKADDYRPVQPEVRPTRGTDGDARA